MKKKATMLIVLSVIAVLCVTACKYSNQAELPTKHIAAVPEGLETAHDEYGADSYNSCLDNISSVYFAKNDFYNMKSSKGLHILHNFEPYQQSTEYSCGPACIYMVLHNRGIEKYNEMEIAELCNSDTKQGTTVEGMCRFLDVAGLKYDFHASTEITFTDLEEIEKFFIDNIDKGNAILVEWQDWGGHWDAVIGIDCCDSEFPDDDVLILADPYDVTDHYQDGYGVVSLARFESMWREGTCSNKSVPYEQPYIVIK